MTEMSTQWRDNADQVVPPDLKPDDRVLVRYRDGIESKPRIVRHLRWKHEGRGDDILAFRFFNRPEEQS